MDLDARPTSPRARLAALRDNRAALVVFLVGFAFAFNLEGRRVPGGNEAVYLLYLYKRWHPAFLAADWTFQESTAGHAFFHLCFGWPTLFLPLSVVAWIGRLCCWTLTFAALLRLGRRLGLAPWLAALGVLAWMGERQSFVAAEWIVATFEAKCVAYVCLLFALDRAIDRRLAWAGLLTGFAFSIHLAVGLWGGAALGVAVLLTTTPRQWWRFVAPAAAAAVPGVLGALALAAGPHAITPAEAKFLVTQEMPYHLDPYAFGWGNIALLYLMLAFDALHGLGGTRSDGLSTGTATELSGPAAEASDVGRGSPRLFEPRRGEPRPTAHRAIPSPFDRPARLLACFELASGAFFAIGIAARAAGAFSIVETFPFRVFAVTTPLLFFWRLSDVVRGLLVEPGRPRRGLAALGVVTLLCLPGPVAGLAGLVFHHGAPASGAAVGATVGRADGFVDAALWVRDHTPTDAVVVAPPWRNDGFYWTQRPLVAAWFAPRFDAMTEWRARVEKLVGDTSDIDVARNRTGEMDERQRSFYEHLSATQLAELSRLYGARYLITTGDYPQVPLHSSGDYRVYLLAGAAGGR